VKKTFLWLFLAALFVIAVGVALFMVFMYPKLKLQAELQRLQINEVELANVEDGAYHGDFTFHGFTYEVEVVVIDHAITQITVFKNIEDDEYAQKAEGVIDNVLKEQSLKVDVITGATITSKALLKTIENALNRCVMEHQEQL
jgi:uncharacterized protein with FMN-binding domain